MSESISGLHFELAQALVTIISIIQQVQNSYVATDFFRVNHLLTVRCL